ncbi:hypothetical protein DFQ00_12926 [Paenibacillus barcinonensis]|uniref:Uncharacterized protein n=1 Tax=Paenibacillus barcinonensis TaxID=198119 RepID=A0A2V4VWL1_PAEBA|nr:hypothetical protein DFQ00_12926 [Paenibacillus barcinonensis]
MPSGWANDNLLKVVWISDWNAEMVPDVLSMQFGWYHGYSNRPCVYVDKAAIFLCPKTPLAMFFGTRT